MKYLLKFIYMIVVPTLLISFSLMLNTYFRDGVFFHGGIINFFIIIFGTMFFYSIFVYLYFFIKNNVLKEFLESGVKGKILLIFFYVAVIVRIILQVLLKSK